MPPATIPKPAVIHAHGSDRSQQRTTTPPHPTLKYGIPHRTPRSRAKPCATALRCNRPRKDIASTSITHSASTATASSFAPQSIREVPTSGGAGQITHVAPTLSITAPAPARTAIRLKKPIRTLSYCAPLISQRCHERNHKKRELHKRYAYNEQEIRNAARQPPSP